MPSEPVFWRIILGEVGLKYRLNVAEKEMQNPQILYLGQMV